MISEPCMRHFDLIICRNILIYFKREIQEQLQINFYHALNENGFLVIGKPETLIGNAANLLNLIIQENVSIIKTLKEL